MPRLAHPGWRGAVLDPDGFHHAKMPRFLFESIVRAVRPERVLLQAYTPDTACPTSLEATWEAFRAHRFVREHWSLEYVLYDASGLWAVLLDPDLLVVGATAALADRIDTQLGEHGTSFAHMTHQHFPAPGAGHPIQPDYLHIVSPWSP